LKPRHAIPISSSLFDIVGTGETGVVAKPLVLALYTQTQQYRYFPSIAVWVQSDTPKIGDWNRKKGDNAPPAP
jgi:hypothetical protein